MTYQQWLAAAIAALQQNVQQDPYLVPKQDALCLLQHVVKQSTAYIRAFDDTLLSEEQIAQLDKLLTQRCQGEPIAYILGEKAFWALDLAVSNTTLIPRPDTECLVETALQIIGKYFSPTYRLHLLDLGTGTGAIALALAYELQRQQRHFHILGVDRIQAAVELAQQNALRHQLANVDFRLSNWFSALTSTQKFTIIVSNPPYIAPDDPHLQQGDIRFEPLSALVAKDQGLADLVHIIQHSTDFIEKNGWLLLEHGWQQAQEVQHCFINHGWQDIQTINDYGGNPRVTLARWDG